MSTTTERPPRPAKMPVNGSEIPAFLKARRQWVVWRWTWKGDKWDKPPINARTLYNASTTDPATWSTWQEAIAAYADPQNDLDGVGYCFSGEPGDVVGVDLDDCRDAATGEIMPWSQEQRACEQWTPEAPDPASVIATLGTYSEVSPSGTGVKMLAFGEIAKSSKVGDFEAYKSGRYFTVTGNRLFDLPAEPQQKNGELETLRRLFDKRATEGEKPKPQAGPRNETSPDDARILAKARGGKRGDLFVSLYDRGAWQGKYPSQSEADSALCFRLAFWCGNDAATMDRLFRGSALFREKWDASSGAGKTYGERTIEGVLAKAGTPYEWGRRKPDAENSPERDSLPGIDHPEGRTDLANARRLVAMHGADMRWCDPWAKWLTWDGRRWAIDDTRRIEAFAKNVSRRVWRDVAAAMPGCDDATRKTLLSYAKATASNYGMANMLALARSEPGVPILPGVLDRNPWLLNLANGTLDLRTGKLRGHDRGDCITKLSPVVFDAGADCPIWEAFLSDVLPDKGLRDYARRLVGYCLTGSTQDHVLPFLYGTGANGKSVFIGTVLALLGGDYAIKAASDLLLAKKHAHPTELADLFGRRFVACIEADSGRRLAEALVKELSGGDRIRARRMREDFWEFTPTHKCWLAANHKPIVRGNDNGIWRRIKLLPFEVTIPPERQDPSLPERLLEELPGILNWALLGCMDWQAGGLAEPESVRRATAGYRAEMDTLGLFLAECCIVGDGLQAGAAELHQAFEAWGGSMTPNTFGKALAERGFASERQTFGANKGRKVWRGIGLLMA